MKIENAEWNGEACKATIGTLKVIDSSEFPKYWGRPFVGTVREVILIEQDGRNWFIDNADGSGYRKVTNGGCMNMPHRGIYGTMFEETETGHTAFDAVENSNIAIVINNYFKE